MTLQVLAAVNATLRRVSAASSLGTWNRAGVAFASLKTVLSAFLKNVLRAAADTSESRTTKRTNGSAR